MLLNFIPSMLLSTAHRSPAKVVSLEIAADKLAASHALAALRHGLRKGAVGRDGLAEQTRGSFPVCQRTGAS